MAQRGAWGSNAGFILAAVGGAVGLGNLWGFAYSASQGGGAAFVVLYFVFVLFVGLPVLTAELVIGAIGIFVIAAALPFLAGFENIIGLLIIGFALWEAWKINRKVELAVVGPFQVGGA